jgi:hypothetical protein
MRWIKANGNFKIIRFIKLENNSRTENKKIENKINGVKIIWKL